MRIRRIALLAAAVAAVVTSLTGVAASATVHPATFVARDDGYGATLALAKGAATRQLNADYGPCSGVVLIDDSQQSSGTWWAEVAGNCTAFH